MSGLEIQGNL